MTKTIELLTDQNQKMFTKVNQLQEEKSKMRKGFTDELVSYKSSITMKMKMENN